MTAAEPAGRPAAGPGVEVGAGLEVAVDVQTDLDAPSVAAIRGLLADASAIDGVGAVDEAGQLALGHSDAGVDHLTVRGIDGRLAGYAQLNRTLGHPEVSLVVAPAHRRRGLGTALLRCTVERAHSPVDGVSAVAGVAGGLDRLLGWAHGTTDGARALAAAAAFEPVRELLHLGRGLNDLPPTPDPPVGVALRTFAPSDADDWVAVNAAAFADHPEQGRWTEDDLAARMAEPWFNPDDFLVAERGGELVGYHWTKLDPTEPEVGEVYVLGISPGAQGGGLGRVLLLAGLHHLADSGRRRVALYVEADNAAARRLYQRYGFSRLAVDTQFAEAAAGWPVTAG